MASAERHLGGANFRSGRLPWQFASMAQPMAQGNRIGIIGIYWNPKAIKSFRMLWDVLGILEISRPMADYGIA